MQTSLFYVTLGPDPVTKLTPNMLYALMIISVIPIMVCDVMMMMICECLKYYERKY